MTGDVWGDDLLKSAQFKQKSVIKKPKLLHSKLTASFSVRRLQRSSITCSPPPSNGSVHPKLVSLCEKEKENHLPKNTKHTENTLSPCQTAISGCLSLEYLSPTKKHCKVSKSVAETTFLTRRELQMNMNCDENLPVSRNENDVRDSNKSLIVDTSMRDISIEDCNFNSSRDQGALVINTGNSSTLSGSNWNEVSQNKKEDIHKLTALRDTQLSTESLNLERNAAALDNKFKMSKITNANIASGGSTNHGAVAKAGNFVKLNMKNKNFARRNSKFSINRKRFKHKQYQRAKSWRENYEQSKFEKTEKSDNHNYNATENGAISYKKPDLFRDFQLHLNRNGQFTDRVENDTKSSPILMAKKEILSFIPEALRVFKIKAFLQWQLDSVMQTLMGHSSIIVKPTGSGKSVCYLLPAWILYKKFGYVTLIISPLISLMDDQTKACPRALKAAAFHSALSDGKKNGILHSLQEGNIGALFVSPESIVEGSLLRQIAQIPKISFACIDEVHCISEWSHNFRPSYFRLCSVLKHSWGIETFLGITATASKKSLHQIAELLNVHQQCLFYDVTIPSNLQITASCDAHRLQSLVDMLHADPFKNFSSILIYCTKRIDCDSVASHIRTVFASQDIADSYHAGKSSADRARIQKNFMSEKLKIVAATVAFGMGLNKPGLRVVIHYNISGSVESFVQEIGRAGRNTDEIACCHTFLSTNSKFDLFEQERHVFSSYVEPSTIRKVADLIFGSSEMFACPGSTENPGSSLHCHFGSVHLSKAVDLDIKEEVLMTLISYLESHPSKPLRIIRVAFDFCSAYFYRGFCLPTEFYEEHPVFKVALKLSEQKCKHSWTDGNRLKFSISYVMNYLDAEHHQICSNIFSSQTKNVGIKVDLSTKSVVFKILCSEMRNKNSYIDHLLDRSKEHERSQLHSLHHLFSNILAPIAQRSVLSCFETPADVIQQENISQKISDYFEADPLEIIKSDKFTGKWKFGLNSKDEHLVRQTVRSFLALYHDMELTGLAVCRILQGIDSPQFPAETWCTVNKFWKSLNNIGFKDVLFICNEEVRFNR